MHGMRTGLEHRLRRAIRQITEQHAQLREIGLELDRVAGVGRFEELATWLARLEDALRAHFELEEEVLFPALHGLDPARAEDLQELVSEHALLLGGLRRLLEGAVGQPEELPRLRSRLGEHERREEALVKAVLAGASD